MIKDSIDFISIDVSFISLKLVFPVAAKLLNENGYIVCLVKPQFEAGRDQVGKNGIVRDRDIHKNVIENVLVYAIDNGFTPLGLTFSPVTGAKGNIEFLLYLGKKPHEIDDFPDIDLIVNNSHEELK